MRLIPRMWHLRYKIAVSDFVADKALYSTNISYSPRSYFHIIRAYSLEFELLSNHWQIPYRSDVRRYSHLLRRSSAIYPLVGIFDAPGTAT